MAVIMLWIIVGLILGAAAMASGSLARDDRAIRTGIWTHDGKAYQLKEIKPDDD